MSHQSRTKRLPKILLGQSLVTLLIISIAGYLALYSLGYKINLTSRKIVKTGLIVLSINPKPDSVEVAGRTISRKDDVSVSLEPGYYDIIVKKDGYQDWSVRSQVSAELVSYYKYVELFRIPGTLLELTDKDAIEALNTPNSVLATNTPKGLSNSEYEVWIKDKLVTRFSTPISQVAWFDDNHHILFQQGAEIRIIDEDGSNNKILALLPSVTPAKFRTRDKNQSLDILIDGNYYTVPIQ